MFRRKVKYTAVDKMLSKLLQKQGLSKKEAFRLIEKNVYASGEEEAASSNPQEEADYPPVSLDVTFELRELQLRRVLLARRIKEGKL
ncbi:hypothetical protein A9B99_04330 [Mangrovibacter phragmitis]|jgi:hypothetical protein|uniref:Uncharacterized protein n=1 Tax=Mangrovibacter phragmitis TaxID=1691903 RepID=A0A1B7L9A2_9ENTR|nr:hypothetical protein [Mangrovibacter phragmitis]OAT78929.1 hypothetical protein A9B99_04330 [Mangrovibacter phragmitis]